MTKTVLIIVLALSSACGLPPVEDAGVHEPEVAEPEFDAGADAGADAGTDAGEPEEFDAGEPEPVPEPEPELTLEGDFTVENSIDNEQLAAFTHVTGKITVSPALTVLDLPLLRTVERIEIRGNALTTVHLPSLEMVGLYAWFENMVALESLDLRALRGVARPAEEGQSGRNLILRGMLDGETNTAIERLVFSELRGVDGIYVAGFSSLGGIFTPSLDDCGLMSLENCGSYCPAETDLSCDSHNIQCGEPG